MRERVDFGLKWGKIQLLGAAPVCSVGAALAGGLALCTQFAGGPVIAFAMAYRLSLVGLQDDNSLIAGLHLCVLTQNELRSTGAIFVWCCLNGMWQRSVARAADGRGEGK